MLHLHIGAKPVSLNGIVRRLFDIGIRPEINGDGWNDWGTPIGVESNDNTTLHLVIPVEDYDAAMIVVSTLNGFLTEPSRNKRFYHITTAELWAEDLPAEELINPELKEALRRLRNDALALAENGYGSGKTYIEADYQLLLSYLAETA